MQSPVAKESGNAKKEPKPAPEPAWMADFRRDYGLQEGEVLKRLAAPFPASRREYAQSVKALYFRASQDIDDVEIDYRWDGKSPQLWSVSPKRRGKIPGRQLIHVLQYIGVPHHDTEMDKELWHESIGGEFVMRTGVPREKIVPRLEAILREELKLSLRLTLIQAEREVIVVGGKYEWKPRGKRVENHIDLFATHLSEELAGGGSGTFDEFLVRTGSYISRRLVNELKETPKVRIRWRDHNSVRVLPGPDPNMEPDGVLNNITAQTGLTFKTEKRTVSVLIVERK